MRDRPDAIDPGRLTGLVEFNDVSFSYDGKRPAIEDLSFTTDLEKGRVDRDLCVPTLNKALESAKHRAVERLHGVERLLDAAGTARAISAHLLRLGVEAAAVGAVERDRVVRERHFRRVDLEDLVAHPDGVVSGFKCVGGFIGEPDWCATKLEERLAKDEAQEQADVKTLRKETDAAQAKSQAYTDHRVEESDAKTKERVDGVEAALGAHGRVEAPSLH